MASHISAENTSRTVRAPSRARVTQLSTEVGCSGSSVSIPSTSSRVAWLSGGSPDTIVTRWPHDSCTPAGSSGRACTSAWKTPSSMRAVCSARASWRPIQYSSWAILASKGYPRGASSPAS